MPTLRSQIELDSHDRALITVLQQDGRIPFVELARRVGLSEKTVRSRVTALLDGDVIRIVALTSPRSLGFNAIAMVGLTTDPAVPATDVARDIAAISGVDYVVVTTGRYSVIVEVITTDRDALREIIEKKIGATPGVRSMEIFPGFSLFYQKARFLSGGSDDAGVRTGALPDIDRQIAFALSGDGRLPFRAVSETVGVSETQVRARVAAMLETRQMSILAIMNPLAFRERTVAWLGLKIASGSHSDEVADLLSHEEQVSYVFICGGRFDIFVELICDSDEHLHVVVETRIRAMPQIRSFELFIYLDLHYKLLGS